jgi:hypothetical protein
MRSIWQLSAATTIACMGLQLLPISAMAVPSASGQSAVTRSTPGKKSLSQRLIGTWRLVKQADQSVVGTPNGQRLKLFTGKNWNITQADPKTKRVIFHHGGTYSLKDNELTSTVDYANESTAFRIGTVSHFKIDVQGDTYQQIGLDNPYTETWQRVK